MTEQGGQTATVRAYSGEKEAGATAAFPFDRATVERFRKAFPRARWRDDLQAWKLEQSLFGAEQNHRMVVGDHDPDWILHCPPLDG